MYTLYFKPHACSLATHTVLNHLDVPVKIINKDTMNTFDDINPIGAVPALKSGDRILREGVAILLYLLNTHENTLLPVNGVDRQVAIENMLFANATMHPAYSRLFFIGNTLKDEDSKSLAFDAATTEVNKLWQEVEDRLGSSPFLGGDTVSAADILLAVYSRWGEFFPVEIAIGPNTQSMIKRVLNSSEFTEALADQERAA